MKIQLFASVSAVAALFAGAALANPPPPPSGSDPVTIQASVPIGENNSAATANSVPGNSSAGGNLTSTTVPGNSSAGGDLTSKDNVSISGGTGNAGGDLTSKSSESNKTTSTELNFTSSKSTDNANTGNSASKGGSINTGNSASKGGVANSGVQVGNGGTINDGNQASKGGSIVTGTAAGGNMASGSSVGGDQLSNFNNGAKTWNSYAVSSDQSLDAAVTLNYVTAGKYGGTISTGSVSLDESGFAGIQTASSNSGLSSANQAATSVAANANVTFGSVH